MATTIFDKPLDHDVSEKLNTGNVYNGLDQESSGYALDARQGKALNQAITNLSNNMGKTNIHIDVSSQTYNNVAGATALFNALPTQFKGTCYATFTSGYNAVCLVDKHSATYGSIIYEVDWDTAPFHFVMKNGTATLDQLALKSDIRDYSMGVATSSPITSQVISYAKTNLRGRSGVSIRFYCSGSSAVPSDLPDTSNVWKYCHGEFKVRLIPTNDRIDGMLILYGFDSNKIAFKACSNDTFQSNWKIIE